MSKAKEIQNDITAKGKSVLGCVADIIETATKRSGGIVEEAKTDAIKERERQLSAAKSEIEQEINRAKDDLRGQVSAIAMASAEKILQREINAEAHNDLLSKLAAEI